MDKRVISRDGVTNLIGYVCACFRRRIARLRNALSEDHLREDVRDVIKLSTGLIGTMAALVLGLLIASAKSSYDTKSTQIKQITTNIIQLDLDLERYGADAQNVRIALRSAIPQ